jgi:hypothetical protein
MEVKERARVLTGMSVRVTSSACWRTFHKAGPDRQRVVQLPVPQNNAEIIISDSKSNPTID